MSAKPTTPELLPAKVESAPPAKAGDGLAIRDFEAILHFALERGASLSEIVAVRRELKAESDKARFDEALAAFQAECPVITKLRGVPDRSGSIAYRYAPMEDIIAIIRPFLHKHGFSYTLDTDTESQAGWVIAKCHVTHAAGHTRTSTAKFPLGTKTGIQSDTQVYGAAMTFASRRVLCNAFGLVTSGEDTDGRTERVKPAGPSTMTPDNLGLKELARELWNVLKPVRGTAPNWQAANAWLWREELLDGAIPEEAPHLSPERMRKLIADAKKKLSA